VRHHQRERNSHPWDDTSSVPERDRIANSIVRSRGARDGFDRGGPFSSGSEAPGVYARLPGLVHDFRVTRYEVLAPTAAAANAAAANRRLKIDALGTPQPLSARKRGYPSWTASAKELHELQL